MAAKRSTVSSGSRFIHGDEKATENHSWIFIAFHSHCPVTLSRRFRSLDIGLFVLCFSTGDDALPLESYQVSRDLRDAQLCLPDDGQKDP